MSEIIGVNAVTICRWYKTYEREGNPAYKLKREDVQKEATAL
ncbi:hypothetical protein [Desulfatiferula olefinivorans]